MKKLISIKDRNGNNLPIDKMDILFVGENYCIAKYKGFGFVKTYSPADGYTVTVK